MKKYLLNFFENTFFRHKIWRANYILPVSRKSQAAMEKPLRKPWESTFAGRKVQRTNYILPTSRKSQAAMEFLMTYGWALLVVLLVIGALAYFGVLNPSRFLPEKVDFPAGLHASAFTHQGDTIIMFVTNGLGQRLTNFVIRVDDCGNLASEPVTITAGDSQRISLRCLSLVPNSRFTADMDIEYEIFVENTFLQRKGRGRISLQTTNFAPALPGMELSVNSFNGDNYFIDSGLRMWSKTSSVSLNWTDAHEFCNSLNYAGYTDWELPRCEGYGTEDCLFFQFREDLASVFDITDHANPPSWDENYYFDGYWGSGLYDTSFAYFFHIFDDYVSEESITDESWLFARCVRDY